MQTCLETAKNANTRGKSKSTEELKKVVIQTKALNPNKVVSPKHSQYEKGLTKEAMKL